MSRCINIHNITQRLELHSCHVRNQRLDQPVQVRSLISLPGSKDPKLIYADIDD